MTRIFILSLLFIFSGLSHADNDRPETIEEAAKILIGKIEEKDKEGIISKTKDDLIMYHFGWGSGIRNSFGLWKDNKKLIDDCGGKGTHPDACSMKIIEKVWELLRASYSKSDIDKIDRINSLLKKITVSPFLLEKSGALEYVAFLNSEIEESEFSGEFSIHAACTSDHYRINNFKSESSKTLYEALHYFRSQMLAEVIVRPNRVLLKPLPFLGSEECNA